MTVSGGSYFGERYWFVTSTDTTYDTVCIHSDLSAACNAGGYTHCCAPYQSCDTFDDVASMGHCPQEVELS